MKRPARKPENRAQRRLVVVAHGIEHARAATRAARAHDASVEIRSAPGAAGSMGPAWFAAMIGEVAAEFPETEISGVLDCSNAPGHALAALRQGIDRIRFTGRGRARARLASIAKASGAVLEGPAPDALDLAGEADPEAACRAHLSARQDAF
ncbi:MAG: hypothetical protein V3S44_06460 [Alphaproteobacteria bacterium]